jgi:hypothetical protein
MGLLGEGVEFMEVYDQMWPVAKLIYTYYPPIVGARVLYVVILLLSIIVFKLGFAKKLPILKTIVIYLFLALGCTIMTFFGAFLPIAEGLAIAAFILIIYKIRLHQSRKNNVNVN